MRGDVRARAGDGVGGVMGFLGVACPTCNTILMLLFGGELLLTYDEPVRIYVAVAGVAVLAATVVREVRGRLDARCLEARSP